MNPQFDTIEELMLELALYPASTAQILSNTVGIKHYYGGWFAVAKDGNCADFDRHAKIQDLSLVTEIDAAMIDRNVLKINIPDNVKHIGYGAFKNMNLCFVSIPDSVIAINSLAFAYNIYLKDIEFGKNIKEIDSWAFYLCRFTEINLPAIELICENAFNGCPLLEKAIIGKSIQRIKEYAFAHCVSLKELIFKGKTMDQVEAMENYPWGIEDELIIRCEE